MNLLFRVVYAAHANGTHHKLALDALRHLGSENAAAWRAVFLKHVEVYLEGSKAPDKEFKDFKNHVLHVRDNFWGGAPEKAESWYQLLVRALREENFSEAVWCAGVLSHYYTDPIHPFHTAQSDAESNIHRAVEWSISKSYNELRPLGLEQGMPTFEPGAGDAWLKDMVIAGAELANRDYETLIANYNFDVGVVDPPAGLDDTCRRAIGRLLVYASSGFAQILDSAIDEAGVEPPEVALTVDTVLATLKIPVKWVARKMADAEEARAVEAIYDELKTTGTVDHTLSIDDRTVRDLHAKEVLAPQAEQRGAQRQDRRKSSPLPQGNIAHAMVNSSMSAPRPGKEQAPPAVAVAPELTTAVPAKSDASQSPASIAQFPKKASSSTTSGGARRYLDISDDVEAAPSIGPKTAARLEAVGIITVKDLLAADPEELAANLNTRHIRPATVRDWQNQSELMIAIPGLRVTHSQMFVGSGYRSVDEIAFADPTEVMSAMLRFAATGEGQRLLGSGTGPNLEAITAWIQSAGEAVAA